MIITYVLERAAGTSGFLRSLMTITSIISVLFKAVTILVTGLVILLLMFQRFETNICAGMTHPPPMQPNETNIFFIVMQELPEWEPGLPQIIRQIIIDNQGYGQRALLENKRITKLDRIHFNKQTIENTSINNLFELNNSYITPILGSMIVEGHPSTYKFMIFDVTSNKMKIIAAEPDRMPEVLSKIKEKIDQLEYSFEKEKETGQFIMAKPLGPQGSEEVRRMTSPKEIDVNILSRIDSLRTAIERPSFLVHVPADQYAKMKTYFGIDALSTKRGLFLHSQWGIIKLVFYNYYR